MEGNCYLVPCFKVKTSPPDLTEFFHAIFVVDKLYTTRELEELVHMESLIMRVLSLLLSMENPLP
jgi:hypothetical protein